MNSISATPARRGAWEAIGDRMLALDTLSEWQIAGLVCLVAAAIFWQFRLLSAPLTGDTSFHVYAGQQILLGHPIYLDVGIIKTPLSAFAAALAIALLRPLGVEDLIAVRLLCYAATVLFVGVIYLFVSRAFERRMMGLLSALCIVGLQLIDRNSVTGPQPKIFLMLFGLVALWLAQHRRFGWAGASATLAFLAWQPGLVFVPIVGLIALLEPSDKRFRSLVLAVVGALVPFVLVLLYLIWNGALRAAWNDIIGANLIHYQRGAGHDTLLSTVTGNLSHAVSISRTTCFTTDLTYVFVGLVGFAGLTVEAIFAARKNGWRSRLPLYGFIFYNLVLGGFTLIDLQGCADLIPLLPAIVVGDGWLIVRAVDLGARLLPARFLRGDRKTLAKTAALVVGVALIAWALVDALTWDPPDVTLQFQHQVADEIDARLGPGDEIQQIGQAFVLVLKNRTNASKIMMFGSKSSIGILLLEPGGLKGWIQSLQRKSPRVITLARDPGDEWEETFQAWLATEYKKVKTYPISTPLQVWVRND